MISGNKVNLRKKKLSDARQDYRWQSDAELARLDAAPLLAASFAEYLLDYTVQLHRKNPSRFMLAIETLGGDYIGNCTCYGIDGERREAEVGIVIGNRDYWDKGYGTDAMRTLVRYVFLDTDMERLHLKTLEWNERAINCFQKCGFETCGRASRDGYRFRLMELHRRRWREDTERKSEDDG